MSIGFATLASLGSTAASASRVASVSVGSSSPAASHASAQRIPSPPAFVITATRRPRGSGLAREQRGDVDQLAEGRGPDHAGLAEERVDRGLGAGERRGVRAGRLLSRARRAALHRENRLPRARAAERCARTCAGCRTTRGRGGRDPCRRSSSHHSSRSFEDTSALFPIETNDESPSPRASARSSSARPSAPLCDEKPIAPLRERARREGRVQAHRRGGDPEAVRADEPRAVRADEREQLLLALDSLATDLGEAGGDHAERADARLQRLPRPRRAPARRGGRSRRGRRRPGSRRSARRPGRRRPARP